MLKISPDWTPEERLKVITLLSERLNFVLRYGRRDEDLAVDLNITIGMVASVSAQTLETTRSGIEHTLLQEPA